jgi:uncharacterized membrane protein YfcA
MDPTELAILTVAAVATSTLSAIIGMAGGIVLLSIMLLFFEPAVVIPLHGFIQLVSNSSRAVVQRKHIDWRIVSIYALPLFPMSFVGFFVLDSLTPGITRGLIGLFVLTATWIPGWLLLGTHPERSAIGKRFFLLGSVTGVLGMTVGAVGPLIAPFFLNLGLARQGVVGTKAACQMLGHIAKIAVFALIGFSFPEFVQPLALLAGSVILGTWIGSRILGHVSEKAFVWLYRGVLSVIALRLVYGAFAEHFGALNM